MKNIKDYGSFKTEINEGFWTSIFGKPTVADAAHDSLRGQGFSHQGTSHKGTNYEDNYIMFAGQKFYPDQIEYDDYNSTKQLPRVENGKLFVSNPAWSL